MYKKLFVVFLIYFISEFENRVEAANKCVWVRGAVRCRRDPSKQMNVDVRVYDRDGWSIFKMVDPDDLMGVTFTERDGTISLDGCGADFDWFPGVSNYPEPYVVIRHNCNGKIGEIIELPEFNTFVPDSFDLGIIELDTPQQQQPKHKRPQMDHSKSTYKNKQIDLTPERGDQIPNSVESKNNRLLKNSKKNLGVKTATTIIPEETTTRKAEEQATVDLWGSEVDVEKLSENEGTLETIVNLETDSLGTESTNELTLDNEETTKDPKREKEEYLITYPDSDSDILLASKPDVIKLKNIN